MKKIFSLCFLLTILFSTNIVNAKETGQCKINDTPEYIRNYIESVRKVVTNTNKAVSKKLKEKNIKLSKNGYINKIYGSYNTLFNWNSFDLGFEYIIGEDTTEIPNQLKRDIKILERESSQIKLSNIKASEVGITYEEICEGLDNDICIFDNSTTSSIGVITILKNSTSKLQKILENQATDIDLKDKEGIILFSQENFELLKNDYSKESIKSCNIATDTSGKKGFFGQILEAFGKLNFLTKKNKNSQNEWIEAVQLLWGSKDSMAYKQTERRVLAAELQRQGIGGDSASAIIGNLDAFNKDGTLLGGKYGVLNSIKEQITAFEETLEIEFPGYKNNPKLNKSVSSKEFEKKMSKIKKQEKKIITINGEYSRLKEIGFNDNKSDTILIDRMVDIHLSISNMINTLNKTCEIAVKVCNAQKRGQGDCGQCY